MSNYYTDEINTLVLISLLKEHGIRRVIASPGTTNISFVGSLQIDPYFEVFSAVDERSAAFMACGMAEESGEPVVLTCTGATASRNYIPGLTEAFYRHLPVLAVTSTQHTGRVGNYVAQVIDRSKCFADMLKKSVELPTVHSEEDKQDTITKVNDILLELTHRQAGPCHINLCTTYSNGFTVKELPHFRTIKRVTDRDYPELPKGRIGVFVGAHQAFTEDETIAIDRFCRANNAVVICDQVSNYRGKFRYLALFPNSQGKNLGLVDFELIIYIGYIHGAYINFHGKELWRVNPDGEIRDPYRNLTYVFEMSEKAFFEYYSDGCSDCSLIEKSRMITKELHSKIPEIPFSNMWIASKTAHLIPEKSILHLSILNTVRAWNYFETPGSVLCFSNTGGYGIDGCMSSFFGSAIANREKEHYMVIGDLSFFYDVNTLLNEIPSNIHILLVNNGVGTEFKNYNHRAAFFGEEANDYMAAKGHNGFRNKKLVCGICEDVGIKYLSASNKNEYLAYRDEWLREGSGPIMMEVFTDDKDESDALRRMNTIFLDDSPKAKLKRSIAGKIIKRVLMRGR